VPQCPIAGDATGLMLRGVETGEWSGRENEMIGIRIEVARAQTKKRRATKARSTRYYHRDMAQTSRI